MSSTELDAIHISMHRLDTEQDAALHMVTCTAGGHDAAIWIESLGDRYGLVGISIGDAMLPGVSTPVGPDLRAPHIDSSDLGGDAHYEGIPSVLGPPSQAQVLTHVALRIASRWNEAVDLARDWSTDRHVARMAYADAIAHRNRR